MAMDGFVAYTDSRLNIVNRIEYSLFCFAEVATLEASSIIRVMVKGEGGIFAPDEDDMLFEVSGTSGHSVAKILRNYRLSIERIDEAKNIQLEGNDVSVIFLPRSRGTKAKTDACEELARERDARKALIEQAKLDRKLELEEKRIWAANEKVRLANLHKEQVAAERVAKVALASEAKKLAREELARERDARNALVEQTKLDRQQLRMEKRIHATNERREKRNQRTIEAARLAQLRKEQVAAERVAKVALASEAKKLAREELARERDARNALVVQANQEDADEARRQAKAVRVQASLERKVEKAAQVGRAFETLVCANIHCINHASPSEDWCMMKGSRKNWSMNAQIGKVKCRDCGTYTPLTFGTIHYRQKRPELNHQIIALLDAGYSQRSIARKLLCSKNTVARKCLLLAEHGLIGQKPASAAMLRKMGIL